MKTWTQSNSGKQIFPLELKPEQVTFSDIPHALAQKVRFSGQSKMLSGQIYSVAQHCVLGARLMPAAFALPFLLHEVSEVYLPDVPAPMKPNVCVNMPDGSFLTWSVLEDRHADAIFEALGLASIRPLIDAPEVKRMDLAMLHAEKLALMGQEPAPWNLSVDPAPVTIESWAVQRTEQEFADLYNKLVFSSVGGGLVAAR